MDVTNFEEEILRTYVNLVTTSSPAVEILLLNSEVQNGLLCVEIDPFTNIQPYLTHMKNVFASNPETLCKD